MEHMVLFFVSARTNKRHHHLVCTGDTLATTLMTVDCYKCS